jgi:hypothetical protein
MKKYKAVVLRNRLSVEDWSNKKYGIELKTKIALKK